MKTEKQHDLSHDNRSRRRVSILFITLFLLLMLFLILDIFLGSVSIKASEVINAIFRTTGNNFETIILKFRLPKAITALIVGVALSLSGLQMQTVFRNPMAGPMFLE